MRRSLTVLMDDDPMQISKAIKISRKCLRIVYQNIVFAIGVKLICLVLGDVGVANMWLAIFADVRVIIIAVLNAIRALFVKNFEDRIHFITEEDMKKQKVSADLKQNLKIEAITQLFTVLSDLTRMRIMFLISSQKKCVYEIADALDMSEAAVSHHLRILRVNDLIHHGRDGKLILYAFNDEHVRAIMAQGKAHVNEKR